MPDTERGEKYFLEVVLPSVGLPDKPTYNIPELMKIMDCDRSTLWKMNKLGKITITQHKRIYRKDIIGFFSESCTYPRYKTKRKKTTP